MNEQLNLFETVNEATNSACFLGAVSGSYSYFDITTTYQSGMTVLYKNYIWKFKPHPKERQYILGIFPGDELSYGWYCCGSL